MTYFTAGEKEVRAWTIKKGLEGPAGRRRHPHRFRERASSRPRFRYEDLTRLGQRAAAREAGKYRLEGRDYAVQDGDVMLFRFSP
jgi:ribosome-binding ATPase YchF (GTP1/OBG family)